VREEWEGVSPARRVTAVVAGFAVLIVMLVVAGMVTRALT
jgi:hypothetical protein